MTSTFDVRLPIRIGDALGVDCCAAASSVFANTAPAGTESWNPRLQDGEPARFGSGLGGIELLINADIEADADQDGFGDETQDQCLGAAGPQNGCPSNAFTLGAITHDKSKGTATLNLTLPNPGELSGSGNGAKVASARAVTSKSVGAIQAQLLVKAKGKKKRKLNETGKVKLTVAVTYTPTGGKPATQSVKVKLKKI